MSGECHHSPRVGTRWGRGWRGSASGDNALEVSRRRIDERLEPLLCLLQPEAVRDQLVQRVEAPSDALHGDL